MSSFTLEERPESVLVKCPPRLDAKSAHELLSLLKAWIAHATPSKTYVLDFAEVTGVEQVMYRPISLTRQALKKKGSFLFSINMQAAIARQLKAAGLEEALSPKRNMTEALAAAGSKSDRPEIDMDFVRPFIEAIKGTLEIQANTPVKIGAPYLKTDELPFKIDIAGVISLASGVYNGSIAVCFPANVFLALYSNMLGETRDEITSEIEDAAGEILNMIFGVAKAELNDKANSDIQRAIPAIVRGEQLHVHHLGRGVAVVIPCQTETGPFHVEMSLEPA